MMLNYHVIDLMSGAVFALILVWIVLALRRCRSVGRYVLMSILVVYLCEVFDLVGIPGLGYFHWDPNIQLIPFSDEHTRRYLIQLGLNAALFVPFGILVPMIWREFRSWGATTGAGFLTSLLIEGIQLFAFRATDVDDLIMNTLGGVLGYSVFKVLYRMTGGRLRVRGNAQIGPFLFAAVVFLGRFFFFDEMGIAGILYGF